MTQVDHDSSTHIGVSRDNPDVHRASSQRTQSGEQEPFGTAPPNKQLVTDGHRLSHRFAFGFVCGARSSPVGDERRVAYSGEASGRGTISGRWVD